MVAHRDLALPDRDLDRAARRAPFGGVVEQIADRPLDRRGHAVDDRVVEVGLELDPRPVAARALDRVGGDQVEAHVSGRLGHRLGPGLAGELDQLADQARSSRRSARRGRASSCSRDSGGQLVRRARGPRCSCFRLVSGVRSSCEASATSCRCARLEASSAPSIVLKLVASRPSSSSPVEVDSIRCERSPCLGGPLRWSRSAGDGRQRGTCDQQAEGRSDRHPPARSGSGKA